MNERLPKESKSKCRFQNCELKKRLGERLRWVAFHLKVNRELNRYEAFIRKRRLFHFNVNKTNKMHSIVT